MELGCDRQELTTPRGSNEEFSSCKSSWLVEFVRVAGAFVSVLTPFKNDQQHSKGLDALMRSITDRNRFSDVSWRQSPVKLTIAVERLVDSSVLPGKVEHWRSLENARHIAIVRSLFHD